MNSGNGNGMPLQLGRIPDSVLMLGVGDFGASNKPGDVVKTMALGSCVAVILLDPKARCVGMVHVALPNSAIDEARGKRQPGYFADTGIPALIREMRKHGSGSDVKGWIVKIAGGANVADVNHVFNVGKRNVIAVKKILWELRMAPRAEDVEKNFSRTVAVDVATGRATISCPGRGSWTL